MDNTKREELEKAYKNYKIRTRMVAVRMVRVRNMSVDETADILVHCPTWARDWLRRYDDGGLEGLLDISRCGRSRIIPLASAHDPISSSAMNRIPLPSLHPQQATRMSLALPKGVFLIMR